MLPPDGAAGGLPSGTEAYYSFDYANVHFVVLDSHDSPRNPGGAMLTWLEADLAAADAEWTIAYWHHPPFTKGSHDTDVPPASDWFESVGGWSEGAAQLGYGDSDEATALDADPRW